MAAPVDAPLFPPGTHESLYERFEAAPVRDRDAAVAISPGREAPQEAVASGEEILVGALERVVVRERRLVDDHGEQDRRACGPVLRAGQQRGDIIGDPLPDLLLDRSPGALPGADMLGMDLPVRNLCGKSAEQRIDGPCVAVSILLVDRQSTDDEVLRLTIPRLIQIEQVHVRIPDLMESEGRRRACSHTSAKRRRHRRLPADPCPLRTGCQECRRRLTPRRRCRCGRRRGRW